MSLLFLIKCDLARYLDTYKLRRQPFTKYKIIFESFIFKAGFQAVFIYRISHWFYKCGFSYVAWFLSRFNVFFTGAEIEYNAVIGPGLFIAHPVGIVIGRGAVLGSRVTIFQGVTIGIKDWHPNHISKYPVAGSNCFFFANSSVFGGITIGNNCVLAGHAAVIQNMEDGSLAMGVPAKIICGRADQMLREWGILAKSEIENG
jgi:serine O-acetyltransferase